MSSTAASGHDPILIVVMGVCGTGKSTLGNALSQSLGFPFVEGDDLHPASNVEKMSSGTPLTDADREPWLAAIRRTAEAITFDHDGDKLPKPGVVITSSALRRYYREILRGTWRIEREGAPRTKPTTYFVFIDGNMDVLRERMEKRLGHFMKASMLDSQLKTLESPVSEDDVVIVSLQDSTEAQVKKAVEGLNELVGRDIRS